MEGDRLMARTWHAVLARTGVRTGDGRILSEGGGSSRDLPRAIMWQERTESGHGGAVVVGRMETLRIADGMVTATGSMLEDIPYKVLEELEAGVIGPSVDLDDIEYVMDADENLVLTRWRVAGATLVAVPAFADVSFTLDPLPAPEIYAEAVPAGYDSWDAYSASLATFATQTREAMAAPVLPQAEWFQNPGVTELTPLTVTPEGRVFGHIAPWGECHIGLPGCVTAPSSMSGYSHFMTGAQRVVGGAEVPAGTLVTGPRHADPQQAFRAAQQHYDDLDAAVAKVAAGEDEFGIWVAGWMLPGASPARVEQFMSSPVSGDWRRVGGSLELIAVCSVNAPGFPVPRARVAFSHGEQRALVGSFGVTAQRGELTLPKPERLDRLSQEEVTRLRALWVAGQWRAALG
jgi:hypothetical protein